MDLYVAEDFAPNEIEQNAALNLFDYLWDLWRRSSTKIKYDCEIFSICGHENFYSLYYVHFVTGLGTRGKFPNRK